MHNKQKTEDLDLSLPSSATLPRKASHNDDSTMSNESIFTGSLPRNALESKFKKSVEFSTSSSLRTRWGKSTNMVGLYSGLQQLRCLFDMMSPGVLPCENVVGALLDLVKK